MIGMKRFNESTAELHSMSVAASHHGHGIGRRLEGALSARAAAANFERIILYTAYDDAAAFYSKCGFREALKEV